VSALELPHVPYADYLARERIAERKSEYLRGAIYAMSGGTPEHARLASRMAYVLNRALEDRACVVFSSDLRVRILATNRSTYPDLTVVCGPRETAPDDPDAVTNPTLIVEVLSDSTEADDRGDKFAHYRHLASLQTYVLVTQKTPRIEVFHREGERWVLTSHGPGTTVDLPALDVSIRVDDVYRDPTA